MGDIGPQVIEVAAVKRRQHGIIADPHTVRGGQSLADALHIMERTGVGTLVVVDGGSRVVGLLTERDVRFASPETRVADRMTPRDQLVVHQGPIGLAEAERLLKTLLLDLASAVSDAPYLVGAGFTRADLTVACMLMPALGAPPDELFDLDPGYRSMFGLPIGADPGLAPLRSWRDEIYRRHRGGRVLPAAA